MRRYFWLLPAVLLVAVIGSAAWGGCAAPAPAGPPTAPEVKLNRIDVVKYEALSKDFPKGYSATAVGFFELALILDITNPNDYPIKLEAARAAIDFEGGPGKWFGVGATQAYEYQWIPAGMTNQLRLNALFTTRVVTLALLVPGAHAPMLKALGMSHNDMIRKWWDEVDDFGFKIRVNGDMNFTSPQGDVTATFSDVFPK